MRSNVLVVLVVGFGLSLMAAPVLMAHHSFVAEYNLNKPITVKGTITKVEWSNPHISFYLDVKDGSGKVTNWGVDAAAPAALARRGWDRTSLKPGDVITVDAFQARSGKPFAAASMVIFPDGRKIFAGSDGAAPR
jgi:hypothetical protein